MSFNTINDVKYIKLSSHNDENGTLVALESNKSIPFEVKRSFYVYGIQDRVRRGKHAHKLTNQLLICLRGSITAIVNDGDNERAWLIDSPTQALYVPAHIWDEQIYHSEDTILLVYSSTFYDRSDYMEEWDAFIKWRNNG